jgi:NTP pyrophosphatase (non-canonical NTP hydrolase)
VFKIFSEFSLRTFVKSTPQSSLIHLKREADEVRAELEAGKINQGKLLVEYADMLLCIISSAARAGITARSIVAAMHIKTQVNKGRKWAYNGDGTYSHIKD